jgi:SNF2 family DNA or RNA helicase
MILKTILIDYQQTAVEKLLPLKIGALYMEMGTGKTRTGLELIHRRYTSGRIEKVLWLCPCSVKSTIKRELEKHAEGTEFIDIYGIESLSSSVSLTLKLYELVCTNKVMLVVDESNLVKNHKAIRTKRITEIAAKCIYRLILNGTPVSRNEIDLYAQWYLLDWRVLGYKSFWSFSMNHLEYDDMIKGKVRRVINVQYLSEKIAPYSYQVLKKDVLTLPEKQYSYKGFYLDEKQRLHYEKVIDYFLPMITEDVDYTAYTRQIYRLLTACQLVTSGMKIAFEKSQRHIVKSAMYDNILDNPRIIKLLNLLGVIEGKCVIWCKYTHEINDILTAIKSTSGKIALTLYGEMNLRKRNSALAQFADSSDVTYLISNKTVGGYGLNLQHCHNMIYYSNDFNWATRAQSEDRLHRIGQTSDVQIYDIYAHNTVDDQILNNLSKKESLVKQFRDYITLLGKDARLKIKECLMGEYDGKDIHKQECI